ncbi:MAG: type II secretion system protein N [Rhodocyclaceae bacterium]|nr:type II secretion system protein N [Rhodocyclaceae bacterium]
MSRFSYGALAVLIFFAGIIVQMPATVLVGTVQELSHQRLAFGDVRGTIWSGQALLTCVRPDGSSERCGDWKWSFVPDDLFKGRLNWRLTGSAPAESGVISLSTTGVSFESLSATLPAFLVANLDPKLAALQLGGRLHVDAKQLATKNGRIDILWKNFSSGLVPLIHLGEITLILIPAPQGWSLGLSSGLGSGPVSLSGEGHVDSEGRLVLSTTVTVGSDRIALAPLLAALGEESGPSVYRLQLP